MLLPLLLTLVLALIGMAAVAAVAYYMLGRLKLDPFEVLDWLGLVEDVNDEPSVGRRGERSRLRLIENP